MMDGAPAGRAATGAGWRAPPAGDCRRQACISSAGCPSCAILPSSIRTIRSAMVASASNFCSTMRTVVPASASRRRSAAIASVASVSSSAVGSSRIRISVPRARVAAMATRCFWPPERVCGALSARSAIPVDSITWRSLCSISALGMPRFSSPDATSSSTVEKMSWASASSKTTPTCLPISAILRYSRTLFPRIVIVPSSRPPYSWWRIPDAARQKVVFPAPVGPVTKTISPFRRSRSIPSRAGESEPG